MRKGTTSQFNPCLRNFVAMGKNYEKALASKSFFFLPHFCLCSLFHCRFRHITLCPLTCNLIAALCFVLDSLCF
uniref:Uncharacterized protein n=1 Tax=Monopterus albus TaxID=43700 RepID=A0A3Q3J4R6_MONAL